MSWPHAILAGVLAGQPLYVLLTLNVPRDPYTAGDFYLAFVIAAAGVALLVAGAHYGC